MPLFLFAVGRLEWKNVPEELWKLYFHLMGVASSKGAVKFLRAKGPVLLD